MEKHNELQQAAYDVISQLTESLQQAARENEELKKKLKQETTCKNQAYGYIVEKGQIEAFSDYTRATAGSTNADYLNRIRQQLGIADIINRNRS